MLWIDADDDRRFANQRHRARGDEQDRTAFIERGHREYCGINDGGENGVNLQAIEALADCSVANDGCLDDLFQKADALLASFIVQDIRQGPPR